MEAAPRNRPLVSAARTLRPFASLATARNRHGSACATREVLGVAYGDDLEKAEELALQAVSDIERKLIELSPKDS